MTVLLEAFGQEPFFEFGVVETGAAVVVDFIDSAIGGFNAVVVAMVPLPPAFAPGGTPAETIVGPGLKNFSNNIFAVVQAERHRDFYIAAGGDLYLPTEKTFWHGIIMLTTANMNVNNNYASSTIEIATSLRSSQ